MASDSPQGTRLIVPREQPTKVVRRFLSFHKNPIAVLILSPLVGILAGLICSFFDLAIEWVTHPRQEWLNGRDINITTVLIVMLSSAALSAFGFFLVNRIAPEASGSGIPEIEGALDDVRPVRWWRVIPVKFFGGIGTIGAGLVLGREGPSVQMGACTGRMVTDIFGLKDSEGRHSLLASGAAAGLAAAFNAPLAGVMFVVEEMRPQFRYNLISIKSVIIAAIVGTITYRVLQGQEAMISLPSYPPVPLSSLGLFLLLGLLFGAIGVLFNRSVIKMLDVYDKFHGNKPSRIVMLGAMLGAFFGLMLLILPELFGAGVDLIPHAAQGDFSLKMLLGLFLFRLIATLLCFCSGAPGGVFAPTLALGTLFGSFFGTLCVAAFPSIDITVGPFAIAGMGALFAATVRAPITGILLIIELTHNYDLILPLLITTLGATMTAQAMDGKPIYSQLLQRTLAKQRAKEALETESS